MCVSSGAEQPCGPEVSIPFSKRLQSLWNGATPPLPCSIASKYRFAVAISLARGRRSATGTVSVKSRDVGGDVPQAVAQIQKLIVFAEFDLPGQGQAEGIVRHQRIQVLVDESLETGTVAWTRRWWRSAASASPALARQTARED